MGKAKKNKQEKHKGKIKLFVYGSLKKELPNDVFLRKADFIGFDSISGPYCMVTLGGFPAVVRDEERIKGANTVYGELWAIDPETLASIDMLEGHPDRFTRVQDHTDEYNLKAWVYTVPWSWVNRYDIHTPPIWKPKAVEIGVWEARGTKVA